MKVWSPAERSHAARDSGMNDLVNAGPRHNFVSIFLTIHFPAGGGFRGIEMRILQVSKPEMGCKSQTAGCHFEKIILQAKKCESTSPRQAESLLD